MTTGNSGAVFFLGSRAHYQVLQQPEARFDAENGNASTETIYQNSSVQSLWNEDMDSTGNYIGESNLAYCDTECNVTEEKEKESSKAIKRRVKRRQSEIALCERDIDLKPALLNNIGQSETSKSKPARRRMNVLAFLASLARRKRKLDTDQIQYLQHIESALTTCTYRESCRCLECQSRYFECDDSDYSSDDEYNGQYSGQYSGEYSNQYSGEYTSEYGQYQSQYDLKEEPAPLAEEEDDDDDDDDEVFITSPPDDNTSTDRLIEPKPAPIREMSVSTDTPSMDLEVAAGAPLLLNYLLNHPFNCSIQ